ncbi:hypothetical protein HC928_00285 [bacterium]|nr:hypothetical protein [bacterium]
MTWWSPKPLRPEAQNPLFPVSEAPVTVRGLNPWQRQRQQDGTPPTVPGRTALRPPDPELFIRSELSKGSLVEKLDDEDKKKTPKTEPVDPIGVLKSFMAHKVEKPQEEEVSKSQDASLAKMFKSLEDLEKATKKHKDPDGGLTESGRKHFEKKEGGDLKPGVKGKDSELSDEEKRRKGSFLTRHYKGEHNAKKPLKDEKGAPTRHALQAQAWGEKAPSNDAERAKLVKDGEKLLASAGEKDKLKKMEKSIEKFCKACGTSVEKALEDEDTE